MKSNLTSAHVLTSFRDRLLLMAFCEQVTIPKTMSIPFNYEKPSRYGHDEGIFRLDQEAGTGISCNTLL